MTDCKKIFVFNGQRLFKKKHIHARLRGDIEQVDNTPFTTTLCYIGPAKNKPVRHQLEDTNHQNNKDCKCQSSSTYYGEIKDKSGNNIVYTDRWHTDTKFWRSSYCITYDCKCQYYYITNDEFKRIMNQFNSEHQIYARWVFKKEKGGCYYLTIDE